MSDSTTSGARSDVLAVAGLLLAFSCGLAAQRPTIPAARSVTENGVFTSFYENGAIRERGAVDGDDKRTGEWRLYWPNGRLAAAGEYQKGAHQGEWIWRDQYGRPIEQVWHANEQRTSRPQPADLWPLRIADLRDGLIGLTTVGALIDRFAAAGDDAAGDAERAEVTRALAAAAPEAVGVPFSIAEQLPAAQRARWLRLCAAMPMPERLPVDQLLAWYADPVCSDATEEVLMAWSLQFAGKWRPLLEPGGAQSGYFMFVELGPKAFGALPELRRCMAAGAVPVQVADKLVAIYGLGKQSPAEPWLAALDRAADDAGRRAEAAQVLAGLTGLQWKQGPLLPATTIMRLLVDSCPAVAEAAKTMLRVGFYQEPVAFDDVLDALAQSPVAAARLAAAGRLAALGRVAEAEPIWRQVAASEPDAMQWFDSWNLLAQHTSDAAHVRELLFSEVSKGRMGLLLPLQRIAADDTRFLDMLVEQARKGVCHIPADVLSPDSLRTLCERLFVVVDDPQTPAEQRGRLLQSLRAAARDDDSRRALMERGLGTADPDKRVSEPAYEHVPLPADLDPTSLPVPHTVLATWADGHPERVAQVVERWLAGDRTAFDAVLLLRPDLRAVQDRVPPWSWSVTGVQADVLRELLPEAAAELRIRAASRPGPGCDLCIGPTRREDPLRHVLWPVDACMVAAIRLRLLDDDEKRRAEGLQLLALLGADGKPLLAALEEALPRLTARELAKVPAAVCAIAPDAAIRLCEPLLDHPDATVVAAALTGPAGASRGALAARVPGGSAFARKVALRIAAAPATQSTGWFAVLEQGIAALPELRAALRSQPRHYGIAGAIGGLGSAAEAAVPELVAALPHNPWAYQVLMAMLPPEARIKRLLPRLGTEQGSHLVGSLLDLRITDPQALKLLERLAGDGREHVRLSARAVLIASASETAVADEARREMVASPERTMQYVDGKHWARMWPQLTAVERRRIVAARPNMPSQAEPLPTAFADAIASMLPEDDGTAFRVLLAGAPLHPRVLEWVEASTKFWNAPVANPLWSLAGQHIAALVRFWPAGDAEFRSRALPWLKRDPGLVVEVTQRGLYAQLQPYSPPGTSVTPQWTRLGFLDLMEHLAYAQAVAHVSWLLRDQDLAVRRAALRALVACGPDGPYATRTVHTQLLDSSWEERFGPLEGLPAACAEIAAKLPTVAQRAATLRQLLVEQKPEVYNAVVADLAAARLLLPELRHALRHGRGRPVAAVFHCLRRLGTDAAELLPEVEALSPIPYWHFEVKATARILRGEAPAEAGLPPWWPGPWPPGYSPPPASHYR